MAGDLSFWKYENGYTKEHSEVYATLSNGEKVQGVAELPVDKIKKTLADYFKDWKKISDCVYDNGNEGVEVFITQQFVRFDCYDATADTMNELIDIMLEYDCKLYDSSINVRFDEE